jgi:uncharacterized membrane protein YphA (DoxX/SURF4 family)
MVSLRITGVMKKLIPYSPPSLASRVFLVLLRLAIGWHLFVEGVGKLETFATGPTGTAKPFSSRGYLQQSQGPLAPYFRGIAGDPDELLQKLITHEAGKLPAELERQWRDYVVRYSTHYNLDATQKKQADALLEDHLKQLREWFATGSKELTREYSFATTNPVLTTAARIAEYQKKLKELRERLDGWNLRFEKDVSKAKVTSLRGEVAKLRGELQKDLDDRQVALGKELDKLLTEKQISSDYDKYSLRLMKAGDHQGYGPDQQAVAELVQAARDKNFVGKEEWDSLGRYPENFFAGLALHPELSKVLYAVCKKNVAPPLRVEDTSQLDLADRIVAWGLTLCGLGLLLGCFTRLSALGGAILLLLFYLALPPLPGLPDNPMAEGKYLFVNKNLIEALALLVLASTASGRWFGIDGLLSLIPPFRYFWPKPKYVEA